MDDLVEAIENTPIIDHHAHNLLIPSEIRAHDLLSITSEANGLALHQGAPSSLAHLRAVHQLAKLLRCDASWPAVQAAIEKKRQEPDDAWSRQCFHGIETALIDDGLDPSNVHPYDWHDRLTRSKCKRIVRIERVAETIMTNAFTEFSRISFDQHSAFAHHVFRRFVTAIEQALEDLEVAGFKSVICYRTGLAVPSFNADDKQVLSSIFQSKDKAKLSRLEDDRLGPYFLHLTARLIQAAQWKKPLQFHTGLGDNDIDLGLSNPAHLQDFIKSYPKVPIVLLHASYPFTTEAGYLATVYSNVWLDIGEVFPFLSQDGQEKVVRDALDLCPSEKLMWSTDGHWFPETYLLATMQVREAMRTVLCDYVSRGALTSAEAIKVVHDTFFKTANALYGLDLTMKPIEPAHIADTKLIAQDRRWAANFERLRVFLRKYPSIKYLRIQWLDYTATLRVRVLPIDYALTIFATNKPVGIIRGVFGLLQDDVLCNGFSSSHVFDLYPVFDSLRLGYRKGYATLQSEFREQDGQEVSFCPRTVLRKQIERANVHGITLLLGFEVEIVFMSSRYVDGAFCYGDNPVNEGGHAWSTARALQRDDISSLLENVHEKLTLAGIELQQFHAESCPGQYEFILGPLPPLEAVDTLLAAREIISSIAADANLRATLYPKPRPDAPGTGAHLHLSLSPADIWQSFYAGILDHLKAISAFTYSNDASYERVQDGVWAGGSWIAWGTQNREAPLRRIEGSHFEIKCHDGLSNPYLALAAIIGTGVNGVLAHSQLTMQDCTHDPATLSPEERDELGITEKFPISLLEALDHLEEDDVLCAALGQELVDSYIKVKRAERKMLLSMEPDRRRNWLIERY